MDIFIIDNIASFFFDEELDYVIVFNDDVDKKYQIVVKKLIYPYMSDYEFDKNIITNEDIPYHFEEGSN